MSNVLVELAGRQEAMRKARNAAFYAAAPHLPKSVRAQWRETARLFAKMARRHNWALVRAVRYWKTPPYLPAKPINADER